MCIAPSLLLPTSSSGSFFREASFLSCLFYSKCLVVAKGRQAMEFVEDHVGQVVVKHADLHVGWLATFATQIPIWSGMSMVIM
jgi:hypothetical protein